MNVRRLLLLVVLMLAVALPTARAVDAADAAAVGSDVEAIEGQSFTGRVVTGLVCSVSNVAITWGDGTAPSADSDGSLAGIEGAHTYAEEGTYTGSVSFTYQSTVRGCPTGTQTVSFQATVRDASLTATGVDVSGTAGRPVNDVVAHFSDANPGADAGDFSARIDWGDGTSTAGTVSAAAGGFDVTGSHTYAAAGTFTVTTSITDVGGNTAQATSSARISPAPPGAPASGAAPVQTSRATIVETARKGTYHCFPGTWTPGLAPHPAVPGEAISFSYEWLRIESNRLVSVSKAQDYRPPTSAAISALLSGPRPYECRVTARNQFGATTATTAPAFLVPGLDPILLGPTYGNFRVRGIDVFQVTQPNSGATQFGFPSGKFPFLLGGGTPNGIRRSPGGLLGGTFQEAVYNGVPLDVTKLANAIVYVDMDRTTATDPKQPLEVTLTRRVDGRARETLHTTVRNPPRSDTYWVTAAERADRTFGVPFEIPLSWLLTSDAAAGSAHRFDLEARVSLPKATALFGLRQCTGGPCGSDDSFRLRGIPSAVLPYTNVNTLQLVRAGQGPLTAPDSVLFAARRLWPGGELMNVRSFSATLDITASTDRVPTDKVCAKVGAPGDTATTTQRTCRQLGVDAQIQQWATDNPGVLRRPGRAPLRIYDFLFGVHDYTAFTAGTAVKEPGWSIGNIESLPSAEKAAQPFFSANANERPITAAAHELGHQLSAPHTAGCTTGEGWPPDETGRLQGVLFRPRRGLARYRTTRVDGIETFYDLMSYCASTGDSDSWVGPRNWNRAFTRLGEYADRRRGFESASLRAAPRARPGAFAVGSVGVAGGSLERVVPTDGTDAIPAPVADSPVRLRSLDAGGRVLLDAGVRVQTGSESESGGTFTGPVATGARRVELARLGVLLDSLSASRAPRVRVTSPRRGQHVRARRTLAVRWRASDPDGGALQATVDATADGRMWHTIFQGPSRGVARVPGRFLEPGKRSRIRVSVNDSFSQATARSAPFSAEGAAPSVHILRPDGGERLVAGERTELLGAAVDAGGRTLGGRSLTWFAGRRRLGRGGRIVVRHLAPGRVTLRLAARDRTGRTGAASRRVRVVADPPRIALLSAQRVVSARARTLLVRVRTAAPATLRTGARSYRVGARTVRLRLRLPARPRRGVLTLRFELRGAGGRTRGALQVIRA